jgi:O-antigen/teichoic acid export membrane protein
LTPLAVLVGLLARDGIMTFYGPTWQEAIVPLQILCFYGFIRQGATPLAPLFMVKNKVRLLNLAMYPNLVLLPLLALPAIQRAGLIGMSAVMVVTICLCNLPVFFACGRLLNAPLAHFVAVAIVPLSAAAVSGLVLLGSSGLFGLYVAEGQTGLSVTNVTLLTSKAAIFLVCYGAFVLSADTEVRHDLIAARTLLTHGESLKALSHD